MSQYIEDIGGLSLIKLTKKLATGVAVDFSNATSVALPSGVTFAGNSIITSASATAFSVGSNGVTNPAFNVDASAGNSLTGLNVIAKASGGGVALAATGGTNEFFYIDSKGNGSVQLNALNNSGGQVTIGNATNRAGLGVNGNVNFTQRQQTSGSPNALIVNAGNHVTLAASVEASDIYLHLARTVQFSTGAITTQRAVFIEAPTYSFVGASTITNAATVAILSAPVAGTNATITNKYAFWIVADDVRIGGNLIVDDGGNIALGTSSGTQIGTATSQKIGFFGTAPVVQQADGVALTNNVTSGGTTNTIANYTDLTVYANDSAAIRNDIYQLARKIKIVDDALRLYGILS